MEYKRFSSSQKGCKKIRRQIDNDLYLTTYNSISSTMELSSRQLRKIFSQKAFSFFSKRLNAYVIAYNEKLKLSEILYEVFHEIGHIYYGHIDPNVTNTISLTQQETAADHFAAFIFSMIGGMRMQTLTGNEHFTYNDMPVGILLNDFWSWNSSDLFNNTLRGALAEFIVASAININTKESRQDWTAYDLLSNSGRKIEVKSSAYLQSWSKDSLSKIKFSIRPTRSWDVENNYSEDVKRWSDLYVFCLYASKSKNDSPLQLEQWEFYLLPTYVLNEKCENQKSITFCSLLALSPVKANYDTLQDAVENLSIICTFST